MVSVARGIFVCLPFYIFGPRGADSCWDKGKPSEVIYPPRLNPDGTRRSSVFSISPGTSPEGRRGSLMDLFKRKGSVSDGQSEPTVKEGVVFNDVDLGKKKDEDV